MWLNNCNWNSIHYLKNLGDLKVTFHYSKRLVQSRVQYCKQQQQQQKKQVSLQAQYNKNIKLTIDKPEKYNRWFPAEEPWLWSACHESRNAQSEGRARGYQKFKTRRKQRHTRYKRRVIIGQCSKDGVFDPDRRNISSWKFCPENANA